MHVISNENGSETHVQPDIIATTRPHNDPTRQSVSIGPEEELTDVLFFTEASRFSD